MRPPVPIVGHRRAIDEITKRDRLAWFLSDSQPTVRQPNARAPRSRRRATDAGKLANFPFAFRTPVAGSE
jgi:hypothetical protein